MEFPKVSVYGSLPVHVSMLISPEANATNQPQIVEARKKVLPFETDKAYPNRRGFEILLTTSRAKGAGHVLLPPACPSLSTSLC
jgi:hypothetical protein